MFIDRDDYGETVETPSLLDKLFCHYIPVVSDSWIFRYCVCGPPASVGGPSEVFPSNQDSGFHKIIPVRAK